MNENSTFPLRSHLGFSPTACAAGYSNLNSFATDAAILLKSAIQQTALGRILLFYDPASGDYDTTLIPTLIDYRKQLVKDGKVLPLPYAMRAELDKLHEAILIMDFTT